MSMQSIAFVLSCWACTCHGRALPTARQIVAAATPDALDPARDLAKVLFAFNPTGRTTSARHCMLGDFRPLKTIGPQAARATVGERKRMSPLMAPLEDREDFSTVVTTASLISLASGLVNVMAFLDMGLPVAHHTGSATHWGRCLFRGSIEFGGLLCNVAPKMAALMVGYASGAATIGFMEPNGEDIFQGKKSPGLLYSAAVITLATILRRGGGNVVAVLTLLAYSQGMLNALTTRCSSLPVRTTHMTGPLTDMGAGLGAWLKARASGLPLPSLRKPILFGWVIFSYALGGFLGHLWYLEYGLLALLLPAGFLGVMGSGLRVQPVYDGRTV